MYKLFILSVLICSPLSARELTDQEIEDADSAPGSGFSAGKRAAEEGDYYREITDRENGK